MAVIDIERKIAMVGLCLGKLNKAKDFLQKMLQLEKITLMLENKMKNLENGWWYKNRGEQELIEDFGTISLGS